MAGRMLIRVTVEDHEYHSLHIMITDNPRCLQPLPKNSSNTQLIFDDVDDAAGRIKTWLQNAIKTVPRWRRKQNGNSQNKSK